MVDMVWSPGCRRLYHAAMSKTSSPQEAARRERLRAALRENLKRRKAQAQAQTRAKARAAGSSPDGDVGERGADALPPERN